MRRVGVAIVIGFAAVLTAAAPAWAHVTLDPSTAAKGSDAVLTFVVPNEMDNATTVKLQVQFPQDHPIPEALVQPVTGWTADVTTFHTSQPVQTDSGPVNDAVDTVTWTASGSGIAVGDFQAFSVSVGLPDDVDSLSFPTVQTYSNKQTVQWIEQTPPGGAEPDHPAPVLTLTSGEGGSTTPTSSPTVSVTTAKKSDVDNAKTIGIIALIVAIVALIAAILGFVLGRRKPAAS
jgi:uncharacterized protein YcnI